MKDINPFKKLVTDWTSKAQDSSYSDSERAIYYECAEKLHNVIFILKDDK